MSKTSKLQALAPLSLILLFVAGAGCGRYRVLSESDGAPPDTTAQADGLLPDVTAPDALRPDAGRPPDLKKDTKPSLFKIANASPLPSGMEGAAYKQQFGAIGAKGPVAWLIRKGKLPGGLILQASGLLGGTPTQIGDFTFTLKAVDDATPPHTDQKVFKLTIKVAPLRVTGGTVYNLLVLKVVVLPVVTIINGVKIPYNTQLQAKGGLKPYSWTQTKLPSMIRSLVPKSGLPKGLTLSKSGKLSGSVSSNKDVITVPGVPLKGFLFATRVTDSQKKADTEDGLFLIPALP